MKRQAIDPPTTIPQPTTLETPTREITFLGCKVQKAPKADDSKPQNAPVETKSRDSKFPLVTTKETPLIARKRQKNSLGTGFRCLQIAKYPMIKSGPTPTIIAAVPALLCSIARKNVY